MNCGPGELACAVEAIPYEDDVCSDRIPLVGVHRRREGAATVVACWMSGAPTSPANAPARSALRVAAASLLPLAVRK